MTQAMKSIILTLNNKPINTGPCHNHTPSKCSRKHPFNKQQSSNPFHNNDNSKRNKINNHTEPNLQLSISINKPDHMAEFLGATRKMITYFKRSYKHSKSHPSDNTTCHSSTNHYSNSHADRHKQKSCNNNDKVNKIINQNCTSNNTPSELENSKEHYDSDSSDSTYSILLQTQNDYHRKYKIIKFKLNNAE